MAVDLLNKNGSRWEMFWANCKYVISLWCLPGRKISVLKLKSNNSKNHSNDINSQLVYATKSLGLGYEQAASFFSEMNLPKPKNASVFNIRLNNLSKAFEHVLVEHKTVVSNIIRQKYIEEGKVSKSDEYTNAAVSFNGTWQKCGQTSHNGIGSWLTLKLD